MNWADYTILAVLALSVLIGLWRGFVAEVFALACWALAFWLAWMFGPALAERFSDSISVPSARVLLAYALCFVAVLIGGALVGFVLRKLVSGSGLSGTDRLLGMVFGLARGVALVVLVVLLLGFTPFTRDPWWSTSQLLPTFRLAAGWVTDRLPAHVAGYLEPAAALAAPIPAVPVPTAPVPGADAPPVPPEPRP
jgi:membrane protein required for colicin V production